MRGLPGKLMMTLKRQLIPALPALVLFCISTACPAADPAQFPNTIHALKQLYTDEITACRIFTAYGEQAYAEGFDGVRLLFNALKASESVHVQNFERLLKDFGVDTKGITAGDVPLFTTTRKNLNYALKVELSEIDVRYPTCISRVEAEGHEDAVLQITYAWKAEKQHRELIRKMRRATGFFFWKLVLKLKKAPHYFVCQTCGSTLVKLPEHRCPICGSNVENYRKIE